MITLFTCRSHLKSRDTLPILEILLALTKALSFPVLFDGTSGSVLCVLM